MHFLTNKGNSGGFSTAHSLTGSEPFKVSVVSVCLSIYLPNLTSLSSKSELNPSNPKDYVDWGHCCLFGFTQGYILGWFLLMLMGVNAPVPAIL